MKKYNIIYSLLAIFILGQACSDDFGDMNVPSDSASKIEPKLFINSMEMQVVANYQRNVSLYPDLYSQYWANTVSGFESPRYEYVDGWIGNQWPEFYTDMLPKSLLIDEFYGDDPYYVDAIAIKEIWMCYWWSRMTDTYGDIPYFDAGTDEGGAYHLQSDIYTDLFARLDKAISSITGDDSQYKYENYDLIFNGDAEKWKRFGNSLRLRLAMRISNVNPEQAKTEALAAINETSGLLSSNDDAVKVPIWTSGWNDYLHQMGWSWNNIRMSKTMSDYLYNQSSVGEDPRTSIWFTYQRTIDQEKVPQTKEEVGKDKYYGLENGYNTVPLNVKEDFATINLEGGYIDFVGNEASEHKMYVPVMFYSEVKFLVAEAVLRGWTSGDVAALYQEGIQASMNYVGVSSDDATAYIDGLQDLSGSNENQLKQIITQKWISNFPNGVEGWADFRRTDYPDLILPIEGVSGNSTVAASTWVKRIRYPNIEFEQNIENIPSDRNTKETDRMDIRVWWDTADTKTKSGGLMNSNF